MTGEWVSASSSTAWKPNETLVSMSIKLKTYTLPEHKVVELTEDDTVLQELERAIKTTRPAGSIGN